LFRVPSSNSCSCPPSGAPLLLFSQSHPLTRSRLFSSCCALLPVLQRSVSFLFELVPLCTERCPFSGEFNQFHRSKKVNAAKPVLLFIRQRFPFAQYSRIFQNLKFGCRKCRADCNCL
jgi:hypothetical protein